MDSHKGKLAFTIGIFIFIFALISLPFLKFGSVEFVIDITTLILSMAIIIFIIWNVRRQVLLEKEDLTKQPGDVKETISKVEKKIEKIKEDDFVKSVNRVILNEVRMKNLSQLSTRFFVASLPQNDSFGTFYDSIKERIRKEHSFATHL